MTLMRKMTILTIVGLMAGLSYAPNSIAKSASYSSTNGLSYSSLSVRSTSSIRGPLNTSYGNEFGNIHTKSRILNGSSTASHYYRVGVKEFEKENLDKAENAFNAVLRADGLDKEALLYLTKIKKKQGNTAQAKEYALAYHSIP